MLVSTIVALICLEPTPLTPTHFLTTEDVRSAWRRPVHTDEVEAWIVAGKPLTSKMMGAPAWTTVKPDDGGAVAIPRGGWGLFVFHSDTDTPAILDAAAFGEAWINGLPRGGDTYGDGHTRLPFLMRAGRNEILLRSGRGNPAPKVWTRDMLAQHEASPGAPRVALLGDRDRTLPDAIEGRPFDEWASVLIYNIDATPLAGTHLSVTMGDLSTKTAVPTIPPLSFLKVPVQLRGPARDAGSTDCTIQLQDASGVNLDTDTVAIRVRTPEQWRKQTFISSIDHSVQYYGFVPPEPGSDTLPGTVLSLHGASVKGGRQASCYRSRPWCMVVAPTNRRPFGFDWEEWGRLDALEAMDNAQSRFPNNPDLAWLTGHSMGGHGTWNIGLTVPERFAAIAPSAGWQSFWTYGGPERYPADGGVRELLRRAANPSDTELLVPNADRFGIYLLHGDQDETVPVSEARAMREKLGNTHADFAYYERPDAGHWWGDECMDWPPLFAFLKRHKLGEGGRRDRLVFVTVDPSASSTCDWASIDQQRISLEPSTIDLAIQQSDERTTVTGTTDNIRRLSIDPTHPDIEGVAELTLDDGTPIHVDGTEMIHLLRGESGLWTLDNAAPANEKNATRSGRLRSAWNNNVLLVVGTTGTADETTWNRARARQDAERWWYRGNGLVEIIDDANFDPTVHPDRGIMLYGNADSNGAWMSLLGKSPIQVTRDSVRVGDRVLPGPLAVTIVRPRPGSDNASVAAVVGTSGEGQRLAATLPLFFSGVGWPDWMVMEPSVLSKGEDGIVGLGFFDHDWKIQSDQSAWRDAVD